MKKITQSALWRSLSGREPQTRRDLVQGVLGPVPASLAKRRATLIAALEPRMLLDGAAVVDAVQAISNLDYQGADKPASDVDDDAGGLPLAVAPEPQRRELAFIDASLPDYQGLVAGLSANVEVQLIEADQDGWSRTAQILEGQQGIGAIHIFGHGSAGEARLGNAVLSEGQLAAYGPTLQRIGDALTEDGDLLLYGCDIGQGEGGQQFITELARLSRADVAASSDGTGRDGDWELEAATGAIEASSQSLASWDHQLGTPVVSGLASRTYTEQEPAKILAPLFSIAGGQYYDDGYFEVRGTSHPSETLALTSSSTPNVAGEISVSGTSVLVGTGSGTTRIGTIDNYYNGTAGRALRINFAAPLTNGGFEDSLDNWTINTSFSGFAGDDHGGTFFGPITQSAQIDTGQHTEGLASLKLQVSGGVSVGYGTAHGPEVVSAEFSASQGDLIALDWKASDSGDDYDVYGFLVDNATGQSYQLFYSRGDYIEWNKLSATIPVTSNRLVFKFYGGTYDATGGTYVGSTLYIDNVRVVSRIVTDSMVSQIGRQVTYYSSNDAPLTSLTLTMEAKSSDGATGSSSMTLSLVGVPDPPVAGNVNKLGGEDTTTSFTVADFTSVSSDPDGPYSPIGGIRIISLPSHGTLSLSGVALSVNADIFVSNLANLTYTPEANWHGTETFSWVAYDGIVYSTTPGTVTIDVASVNDAPVLSTSSGNVTSINGSAVVVDSNLNLYDADNGEAGKDSFSQFKVYINDPQGGDYLDVSSLPGGFSKSWDGSTYVLTISGTGTAAQYRDILRRVTYSTSSASGSRTVTFTSSENVGLGGHYYELVNVSNSISWTDAYNAARSRTFLGMGGYLAAITSQTEQSFISSKVNANTWIGLTDDPAYAPNASEGNFRWAYGSPEQGTAATYSNYAAGEPNDFGSGEDYTHMYADGQWNDFPNSLSVMAYIVEYSGGTPDASLLTATRDVQFAASNSAPTLSAVTASTSEDTTLTFTASQFTSRFSDSDGNALARIRITSLPANGSLSLDGQAVVLNQDIGTADLGRLKFTPSANWSGSTNFSWNGFDGNVFANSSSTVTITVNAVNDAPTLDASASPYLDAIVEDTSGDAGTSVSTLIARGSLSDVDGPAAGLAVVAIDNTNGVWQYNTGSGWTDFSATTGQQVNLGSSTRLLSGASLVRFVPSTNWNGTATLSVRPWDASSGSNGGTADPFAAGGNTSIGTRTADLDTVAITVSAVNDAPSVTTASTVLVASTEDDTAFNAQTVAGFVAAAIADLDANPLLGIALTAQSDGGGAGTWQYSTNNGTTWAAIGSVSAGQALLLRASDQVRFVPNLENGGTGSLTWRAWDRTDANVQGTRIDMSAVAGGGTSAFSTSEATSTITLSSVNDAPTLTAGTTLSYVTTDEDTASASRTVAAILADSGWGDVDTGSAQGIVVTGLTQRHHWQYATDGTTWVNMTDPTVVGSAPGDTPNAVGSTRGLLLSATTWIRYNPDAERGETASFTFRAWDGTSGTASTTSARGFGDPTATNAAGGKGSFSAQAAAVSIVVSDVNDAPTIHAGSTPGFNVIGATEDDTTISAQTVENFARASGGITEVDDTTVFGIAVTAQDDASAGGTWEYSINNGTTWAAIGSVSTGQALLLRASDQVRFSPNARNGGTGSLSWRAWDRTDNSVQGTRIDLTGVTGGGTGAFSSATVTRTTTLASINDAPTATAISEDGYILGSQVSKPVAGVFADVDRGDVLTYSATGLPDGITINRTTGVLSGVPVRPGNYEVAVTANDGNGGTVNTTWRVRVVAPVSDDGPSSPDTGPRPSDGPLSGDGPRIAGPKPTFEVTDPNGIPGHQNRIPVPEGLNPMAGTAPAGGDSLAQGGPARDVAIDRVDVSVRANGQVDFEQPGRAERVASVGLMLVETRQQNEGVQIEIADFKASQVREYRATLLDGQPLPEWVRINPATGQVDATPPAALQRIDLRILALDADGNTRLLELRIDLEQGKNKSSDAPDLGKVSQGLPGFTTQVQQAHATHQGDRHALVNALRHAQRIHATTI